MNKEKWLLVYTIIANTLKDALGAELPKNQKKRMQEIFAKFSNVARERESEMLDFDQIIDLFDRYATFCKDSFEKWNEATVYNWLGYLSSSNRMQTYFTRLEKTTKVEQTKDLSTWNF